MTSLKDQNECIEWFLQTQCKIESDITDQIYMDAGRCGLKGVRKQQFVPLACLYIDKDQDTILWPTNNHTTFEFGTEIHIIGKITNDIDDGQVTYFYCLRKSCDYFKDENLCSSYESMEDEMLEFVYKDPNLAELIKMHVPQTILEQMDIEDYDNYVWITE